MSLASIQSSRSILSVAVHSKMTKVVDANGLVVWRCEECGHVGENWICLICLTIHCSRYVKEHMLIHGAEKEHSVTLSFSDISVWCYTCNDYIDNPKLYPFKNAVHKSKFGEEMPKTSKEIAVELTML